MSRVRTAVNLEKSRDLFCTMCVRYTCYGVNEVNQAIIAMIEFMSQPDLEYSNALDAKIAEFKKRFSENIEE